MSHTNEWTISFHTDVNRIVFYETPDWILFIEAIVCSKLVSNWLPRFYKGYQLWNNIIGWTYEHRVQVYHIDVSDEALQFLAPDERWLWDENYEEDE